MSARLKDRTSVSTSCWTTIARWLHERTRRELPQLTRVDLFESEGCGSLVGVDLAGPALPV